MAIEKNDINFLNNIQIQARNNRRFFSDIRNTLFFTNDFDIEPSFITKAQDLIDLEIPGLDSTHAFYQLVESAYTQKITPVCIIVYGNTTTTDFKDFIEAYKENEKSFEVFQYSTNIDISVKKEFYESIVSYAKTDKNTQFYLSIEIDKFNDVTEITEMQKNANADNVALIIEGKNNLKKGLWLNGAIIAHTGGKKLGSYIVHSLQIVNFLQENYTESEQVALKDAGLNFISKPVRGYFCVINGFNTDNKMFIELKLIEIWLRDRLTKDITITQITQEKLKLPEPGSSFIKAAIIEICRQGSEAGMFLVDSTGNFFGEIRQIDENGNSFSIKLGYLNMKTITQDDLREGRISFELFLTYQNGIRFVELNGTVTTDGILLS